MLRNIFLILLLSISIRAENFSSAQEILAFARAQLPSQPVRMIGTLKERAPNGYVKKTLSIEMDLHWGANPASAIYRIHNAKLEHFQTLEIQWLPTGPDFHYAENSVVSTNFDSSTEIDGTGVTWADLSFSFLWSPAAQWVGSDKKLGRDCFILSVLRSENHCLFLWIEKETGRMLGAKEKNADGKTIKEIKVVSVKEFNGLWMVKDLDIFRRSEKKRTTLRVENVEPI